MESDLTRSNKTGKRDDLPKTQTIQPRKDDAPARSLPEAIGRYRIIRLIGEGGMGAVYKAEQEQPRRTVALKVIKTAWASPELLRRFEKESEALARLHHPGIAQVYEAGTADTGSGPVPYFAMEFIANSERLTSYAATHSLNLRRRLELVAVICDAVQHAHQRGIIHRDLKPGNILVDENGHPKILDFGVARMTDSDVESTRQTDIGQLVGTLAYMSPEQALADPLELDTRTDVYAIGVILYELLAGKLPYDLSHRVHEAVVAIREQDPLPLTSVNRSYRGDIETIVTKALEKDKARRYASAADLAADIRRYLANEPIVARPASTIYHLQKFALRHRSVVAAVAVVFLVLLAGIAVSSWEALRAGRAEQESLAVNRFLQDDLLAQADVTNQATADTKPDPNLTVRTALDRAAVAIEGKFAKQPLAEASIRATIGRAYRSLGLYPQAETQLDRALAVRSHLLGEKNADTLTVMNDLGWLYHTEGKNALAARVLSRTLDIRRRVSGQEHPATLEVMNNLANVENDLGRPTQAEELLSKSLAISRRALGEENPFTMTVMDNLAVVVQGQGKYAQAEEIYTRVLAVRRRTLGEEHPGTLTTAGSLGLLFVIEGKYGQAEPLFVSVLKDRRRIFGENHPDTLSVLNNLGLLYINQGKYHAAEPLFTELVARDRQVLGETHPQTTSAMNNLALTYSSERKYGQAEEWYGKAIEIRRRVLGDQHPSTLNTEANLAQVYRNQGNYAQAEGLLQRVLDGQRRVLGEQSPATLNTAAALGRVRLLQKKYAEAVVTLREAARGYAKALPDRYEGFKSQSLLGAALAGEKKYTEAEPLLIAGYEGMMVRKAKVPAADLSSLEQGGQWIVALYVDWEKPSKAAEWRKKLEWTNYGHP